jgi:hypothetical protein
MTKDEMPMSKEVGRTSVRKAVLSRKRLSVLRCLLPTACCLLAVLAPPAAARDLYVSNVRGDDRATGGSQLSRSEMGGPVRSIGRALRLAEQGDQILIENTGEPYRESLSLSGRRNSGNSYVPLVIEGNGATLDGSQRVPDGAWEFYRGAVFRFRPAHLAFAQLFLKDHPLPQVVVSGLVDAPPKLEPLDWCLLGGYIYFCVDPTKLPDDYPLWYAAKPVGITLLHVDHVVIRNLVVEGFQLDGINALNSADDVRLVRVTSRGNGRSGITVGGASRVAIQECLVGNNGAAQLLSLPLSETHVNNTSLLSNTAPAWVDQGGRVYLDGKKIEGGLDERKPEPPTHGDELRRKPEQPAARPKVSPAPRAGGA